MTAAAPKIECGIAPARIEITRDTARSAMVIARNRRSADGIGDWRTAQT